MNDIGSRIFEARKRRGLSQRQLAEAVGVTVQAVSQWENGKTDPTSRIVRISAALHCDGLWLAGERETPPEVRPQFSEEARADIPVIEVQEMDRYLIANSGKKFSNEKIYLSSTVVPVGELFAIKAPRSSEDYNEGDILIFDNGIEALAGDTAAIMILHTTITQLSHPQSSDKARKSVVGAIAKIDSPPGSEATPVRRMVVALDEDGKEIERAIIVVATLVEHRRFRRPRSEGLSKTA